MCCMSMHPLGPFLGEVDLNSAVGGSMPKRLMELGSKCVDPNPHRDHSVASASHCRLRRAANGIFGRSQLCLSWAVSYVYRLPAS